jgi:hypothetical protein
MEPRGSSPCSQEPPSGPCPESDKSSAHLHILFVLRSSLILSSHLCLCIPSDLFLSEFMIKILCTLCLLMSNPPHPQLDENQQFF